MLRKTCPWLSLPTSTLPVSRQAVVFLLVFLYRFFLAHYTQCPSDSSLCLLERQRISSSKLSRIWRDTWRSWRTSGNSRASKCLRFYQQIFRCPCSITVKTVKRAVREVLGPDRIPRLLVWGNLKSPEPWWRIISGWLSWEVPPTMKRSFPDWDPRLDKYRRVLNTGNTFSLLLGHGYYVNNCFRLLPCWLPYQDRLYSWTMTFLPYVSFVGVLY